MIRGLLVAVLVCALLGIGGPWLLIHALSFGRVWKLAEDAPPGDVALVMGAGVRDGRPTPYLQARLDLAIELWREGKIKVFIVSGSTSDNEPATMHDYLLAQGVDGSDIVLDTGGDDSYASCARAAGMFKVSSVTVISQSYHVPRTVATCRMVGIDAVGVGDDTRAKDAMWRRYERRELAANVKMIVDVLLRRDVGQSVYDPAVQDALARHR